MKLRTLPAVAGALLLVGCARAEAAREAEGRLCVELDELQDVLAALPPMTPATTVEQVRQGHEQVRSQLDDVYTAARELNEAPTGDLRTAFGGLEQVVRSLPGSGALEEAAAGIQPQIGEVERARGELYRLHCVPAETAM